MKKAIYIIIGIAGIILPGLPATPFLLMASFCFAKGSQRLNLWFKETTIYKKYVSEYVHRKSLTLKQKISIQIFIGIIMAFSFAILNNWILKGFLIVIFIFHVYIFSFRIKTYEPPNTCKNEGTNEGNREV